jgi:hypothetical protein
VTGNYYTFKVQARNLYDLSDYTSELTILCAEEPAMPDEPTTRRELSNVIIEWTAPSTNGADITSYTISIG